jgi:hypothetical protein
VFIIYYQNSRGGGGTISRHTTGLEAVQSLKCYGDQIRLRDEFGPVLLTGQNRWEQFKNLSDEQLAELIEMGALAHA